MATAGTYTVSFRVASPYGITDALHITNSSGTNLTGSVAVPNTGGYETWTTVTASVTLPAGVQTLTVDQDSNGFNFHYLAFATGSGGGSAGAAAAAPAKYCGTTDLAMDQPTTASSVQASSDYLPYYATDGDPGTRWSSASSDPQWLEVDLGTPTAICSVGLLWEAAYATAFQIQMSNDNSTWTTVYSTTTGTGGQETFPISTTARYIRMYATARATTFGYSIFEFDVYGPTNTPPLAGGNGNGGNGNCPWVGSTAPVATRVQQVLNTMDQAEEASLLSGDGTSSYIGQVNAIPDLCIPSINMEDGPSGVGDGNGGVTAFPDGENEAATFDPTLVEQEGSAMGAEFAGKGATVSLGPTANLVRDPRWGRTYETYGEDPYLAGQITSAQVEGIQSQGVMAMVKHVAAYDQEQYPNGTNNETVGQQPLEELYLAPFQTTIQQAAPAAMMCSYAVVNNAASCESADLLQDGLYEQANYGGFVTSDWGAAGSAVGDANAGMAVAMPFSDASNITAALTAGTLSQTTVNSLVSEILTQMFAFGNFDNPQTGSLSATVTSAAHQQTALKLGEEGTVLLKNNGLLPLNPNPSSKQTIAVIGTDGGAAVELAGGGSGGVDSSNTVWPLTGIQNAVGPNVTVTYTAGDDNGTTDIPAAVTAAQAATDAIIFVNLPEGEESDLTSLDLSSADETMIADVAAANPHTIVVINSGGPVVMPWLNSVAGVFENWYGGGETGAADAALIFGTVDPSGKLPVTFPASLSQVPAQTTAQWPGTATGVVYSEGVDIGYRWYQSQNITPLFPFGFGLSYTKFAFSNLSVGRVQRRRQRHGDRDDHQHRVGRGRGRGADVRRRPGRQRRPARAAQGLPAGHAQPRGERDRHLPAHHPRPGLVVLDRERLGSAGGQLFDQGRRLVREPAAERVDQPRPDPDRPGRGGHLRRGHLGRQHRRQRERHRELGRAGRGDRRRRQPVGLQQPQGRGGLVPDVGGRLQLGPDPDLHRDRAAARHLDRVERHDLRFRQHARDLHGDGDRDRHEGSIGYGHLRVVRRAVS